MLARALLLLAVALAGWTAHAQIKGPTPDAALALYAGLKWGEIRTEEGLYVCLPKAQEPALDGLVVWLHNRATGKNGTCI